MYKDKCGPDKAFHIALKRQRGIVLSSLTAQKRQANFNTLSIDELRESYNDSTEGLFNITDIKDIQYDNQETESDLVNYIGSLPPQQILILDQICFNDWNTLTSVVNNLKKLNSDNYDYYNQVYKMNKEDYYSQLRDFYTSSNKRLLINIKRIVFTAGKKFLCL